MNFTKTLLAGAAFSALTAASATAFVGPVPNMHLAGHAGNKAIQLKASHHKTTIRQHSPSGTPYTYTLTFSGSFAISSAYKNPIPLPAYTWYNPSNCTTTGKESIKYSKDKRANITPTSSTGSISGCTGTTFTFYGGNYTLHKKKTKSDHFVGNLRDKGTTNGYNYDLVENFNFTFHK